MNSLICSVNRFIEIIKYTWKAKGRHGIHSPFVYDLMDQCFRKAFPKQQLTDALAQTRMKRKVLQCLFQLAEHFKITELYIDDKWMNNPNAYLSLFPASKIHSLSEIQKGMSMDHQILVYIDAKNHGSTVADIVRQTLNTISENSILVIDGIRANNEIHEMWKQLTLDLNIHFSADLYQFGLLATRGFQEKEHFVLRYQ
jgi:hypothetical protein